MTITRRRILAATAAAPLAAPWIGGTARAEAKKLKISHQFPSGTLVEGDFRDRLCRRFAAEVEKRTGGALKTSVYAGSSLMIMTLGAKQGTEVVVSSDDETVLDRIADMVATDLDAE